MIDNKYNIGDTVFIVIREGVRVKFTCNACDGYGKINTKAGNERKCLECNGSGKTYSFKEKNRVEELEVVEITQKKCVINKTQIVYLMENDEVQEMRPESMVFKSKKDIK